MRAIHSLSIAFAFFLFSNTTSAQCECPPLPDDQGVVEVVGTVAQLQSALQQASQNSGNYTILLEDGTYELANNLLYIGDHMPHLTIRSQSGNRDGVILMGQGMDGNVGWIFNVAADHFTAADMTIGWVANHAVQIHAESDADYPLIQNIKFVNIREQMLKVSGSSSPDYSDSGVVQCCEFIFPDGVGFQYYTGGIDAHRAKDWEVRNNSFQHIRSPDNGLAEHAIHFWSESHNTLVENNQIVDCDRGIGFGLGSNGHTSGTIRNNWVHTTRDVGIGLENASNVKVYHNTVFTENYFNSIEYRFTGTVNAHIVNNLTNESIASRDGGTGTVESNFQFSDPSIFVDAGNHDYHLEGAHASITNLGLVLSEAGLDADCHARSDGMPDLGADEFQSVFTATNVVAEKEMIRVFPNPNAGEFFIHTAENLLVELFHLNGERLERFHVSPGSQSLLVEALPSGLYFLKWQGEKSSGVKKIIISK